MSQETFLAEITNFETAKSLGLNDEEFEKIQQILGRYPNFTELSVFSVMWSEHCSYKNSIKYLKTLPRDGEHLLVEAGEENAGLVDIGDGLACAFKIESHNHPSAIEPYQGAATGVGGIHRDIFTMGARPIAALNSLRFGEITEKRTQHLMEGVVKGIGDYGNCLGVPTIGGEVYFHPCYHQNILVNAMSVGIVSHGDTVSAIATGEGNPVFIVGSATGKDGIHGATFASADLTEDSAEDLPSVQVGDPFQEKLLLEASLEVIQTGALVGMQDMGAAGISCSTSEMSAKGNCGMKIDLDKVPLRQSNMEAFEILLSESQERMLLVAKKGSEHLIEEVFEKWDLPCHQIGEVTTTGQLEMYYRGEKVVDIPAESLVLGGGAPVYDRSYKKASYLEQQKHLSGSNIKDLSHITVIQELIRHPNIASKNWITEQYDSTVRTNTLHQGAVSDAAAIRLKGTNRAIAVSTDCNSSYTFADPYVGGMIAVAEAARNIACTGGRPLAITNCLNFGNPYNEEVYWQFVECIRGMGDACRKFNTPVTGGNVSFYNQSVIGDKTIPVYPTPTIGMMGLVDDLSHLRSISFQSPGDTIVLIGLTCNDLNSSEFARTILKEEYSKPPQFDLDFEFQLQRGLHEMVKTDLSFSLHDVSDGGLVIALLESCFENDLGFSVRSGIQESTASFWYGEGQGRVILSIQKENIDQIINICDTNQLPFQLLGEVTDGEIDIDQQKIGAIHQIKDQYFTVLQSYLK